MSRPKEICVLYIIKKPFFCYECLDCRHSWVAEQQEATCPKCGSVILNILTLGMKRIIIGKFQCE